MTTESNKSAGSLLTEALSHVSSLMRKEVDLARAEVNENLKHAGVAIGLIVGAVVVALTALNVLSAALVAALTEAGIAAGWSAVIVGVLLAIVAYVMIQKGTNDLKFSSLAPSRTAKNVKRDAETMKEVYDDK
ncbi:phage holin family protein [Sulfitobacter sp. KE34]|uniref:Phage holin family protein n=1 Tax=Sulfitobacter faviae TaxID=1775881 RepID=A0AAX3LS64_9RHOB|nr:MULTISPECIES: phage holin family protein [Sulfitobacter]MDF3350458.1 phage holin family protein [Sulfitobacter sp. KE12]MDF3354339.1 phage holin family protein [Sulfitobacter sp. KE27]MDF3357778.1 phage holin family protein [Sulfitobacter sp. KE33]MDF3360069.1 phage holin family protein [Sulfitobacter sp. Ks41]MDF3365411.1 phage holin family protein [Sulfitobacter sp. Ks34]|tara:strand:+ start:142 stop:540 length:399 start_codon:yes stop_codon:yes gene_type:complete